MRVNKLPAAEVERLLLLYAQTRSPEYRDLGESNDSTPTRPVFVFECSFAGLCAIAEAPSKKEAKLAALSEILKQLKKKH